MTNVLHDSRALLRWIRPLAFLGAMFIVNAACAQAPGGGPVEPQTAAGEPRPSSEAPSSQWQGLPPLVVERVYRGPLRDTVVQRLRDPVDGATCFIYVPMSAGVAAQGQFLVYGGNTIGSISCFGPAHVVQSQRAPTGTPPSTPPAALAPSRSR